MKYSKLLFLTIVSFLIMSSCNDDAEPTGSGDLQINFKLVYDDDPLEMLKSYELPNGIRLNFNRVSFYVSDIKMFGTEVVELGNNDYINLTNSHASQSSAIQGFNFNTTLKEGNYNALSFLLGVSAEDNAMVPSDFTSDSDLSLNGEYWAGWESYVFVKIEGNLDLDEDGVYEEPMALHIGGDNALAEFQVTGDLRIDPIITRQVPLTIDLYDMLTEGGVFDLEANPRIHSLDQEPIVIDLAQRFVNAISIN